MTAKAKIRLWRSGFCSAGPYDRYPESHKECDRHPRYEKPCACPCHWRIELPAAEVAPSQRTPAPAPDVEHSRPQPQGLAPGSPEWDRRITASKAAAILGVSPWDSPRSVWHQMRGDVERPASSEIMKRGHYLEPAILAWWRDRHDIKCVSVLFDGEWWEQWNPQPVYELEGWASATPDGLAFIDGLPALVEAKSAAYDDDWGDPGTDVIPAYYLAQVYWQMHVSGVHRCYVPIIGPRLKFAEYVVDYDPAIGADLEQRMRAFYDSLSADEPPPLDDSVATFNVIRKLHKDIERGETVELSAAQAVDLVFCASQSKQIEADLRLAKSTVIDLMGRAQYATRNGVRIARRQPRGEDVTFVVIAKPADLSKTEENEE